MGRLFAVEIVYRGIFQKTLAKNISRAIVLAAHEEGKPGISFGRYGDSPERNGIPAKSFAIVATDDVTLEEGMAKYEPKGSGSSPSSWTTRFAKASRVLGLVRDCNPSTTWSSPMAR